MTEKSESLSKHSTQIVPSRFCLVLCTCPNDTIARQIAKVLVSRQLAACINILPGVSSIYSWDGEIQSDQEHLMLIKTDTCRYSALESSILEIHPYELPEVIAVPLQHGYSEYLRWIHQCLDSNT